MKSYKFLVPIAAMLTMTLVTSNTLDTKIFTVAGLNLPAGIILFPLAYLIGDVLTEVYGYAAARRVIWSALFALVVMLGMYEVGRHLPPAPFWQNQAAFDAVFSHVPRIVLGSILAYLAGEFTNSYIVARMKLWSEGRWMAGRFVASTLVGQFVDTSVFVAVAFTGAFPPAELVGIVLSAWMVKVGWELLALPFTLWFVRWIKRAENEDVYDHGTNFTPFRL